MVFDLLNIETGWFGRPLSIFLIVQFKQSIHHFIILEAASVNNFRIIYSGSKFNLERIIFEYFHFVSSLFAYPGLPLRSSHSLVSFPLQALWQLK